MTTLEDCSLTATATTTAPPDLDPAPHKFFMLMGDGSYMIEGRGTLHVTPTPAMGNVTAEVARLRALADRLENVAADPLALVDATRPVEPIGAFIIGASAIGEV